MANYHLEITNVSRGKGHSIGWRTCYITGERVYDSFFEKTYYHNRHDVQSRKIFLPNNAPPAYRELQTLCDEVNKAEKRYDARTAREFIGSLPNELQLKDLELIVSEFVNRNFVERGLCAIAAIHEGRNERDPSRNNPHVHILVSTRTVGSEGFDKKKYREHDKRIYINIWREQWAAVQNRAYERERLDIHVSHESLEVQGIRDREPAIHLSRIDWQKEQRGERTRAGDRKREIEARNRDRKCQRELQRSQGLSRER